MRAANGVMGTYSMSREAERCGTRRRDRDARGTGNHQPTNEAKQQQSMEPVDGQTNQADTPRSGPRGKQKALAPPAAHCARTHPEAGRRRIARVSLDSTRAAHVRACGGTNR